jgi:hypothetical protein
MKKVLLALLLASCAGTSQAVRENALLPALQMAWGNEETGVKSDIMHGIEISGVPDTGWLDLMVQNVETALFSGSIEEMRLIDIAILAPYARAGIQDRIDSGEWHFMAAEEPKQQLENFLWAWGLYVGFEAISFGPSPGRHQWLPRYGRVTDEAALAVMAQ